MLGRRNKMTQTEDDVTFEKDDVAVPADHSKMKVDSDEVKTVVKSPAEEQRNDTQAQTVILKKDNVEPDKKIVTNNVKNSVDTKTEQRGRKHTGDEM